MIILNRMKKNSYGLICFITVTILVLGGVTGIINSFKKVSAQSSVTEYTSIHEAIKSYSATVKVNIDNSVNVTEIIRYKTGLAEKHGIYRDINVYSSEKRKMNFTDISVTDETGFPYQYKQTNEAESVRLKIGDPSTTFNGEKVYVIRYKASNAVAQLKDVDEIYWNVTGNDWTMPIEYAEVYVTLPNGAILAQDSCYYGPAKSTARCQLSIEQTSAQVGGESGESVYLFRSPTILSEGEGLTVVLGFQKGVVTPYTSIDNLWYFISLYLSWILAILLPVLSFIFTFRHWLKYGKDPKGTGVIVPQYDVPDNLTPIEVDCIVNQKFNTNSIAAQLIYLAVNGYIKINQIEKKLSLGFKRTDYEFIKLKDYSDLPNESDRMLLDSIFKKDATSVKLSNLKNEFHIHIEGIKILTLGALLSKGYYKNLGVMKTFSGFGRVVTFIFIGLWASLLLGIIISIFVLREIEPLVFLSVFLSVMIYGVISNFSPSKTEKGVVVKEYLLGLKDYLQIAEKDRLHFHNAPERKPETFDKLLPYAMVMGVAKIWAKEFEGIYTAPPTWYSSSNSSVFNAVILNNALSDFSTFTKSTISATQSSGSRGSGSSGGGGGGGGGGSW
jgi:uncharacterized membrane protein